MGGQQQAPIHSLSSDMKNQFVFGRLINFMNTRMNAVLQFMYERARYDSI